MYEHINGDRVVHSTLESGKDLIIKDQWNNLDECLNHGKDGISSSRFQIVAMMIPKKRIPKKRDSDRYY